MKTTFKVKEDFVHIEIEVSDNVKADEKTSEAIDRIFGLVERKVAEKAQRYIDNT